MADKVMTNEDSIREIDAELAKIDAEIRKLNEKRSNLKELKEKLKNDILVEKSLKVSQKKWDKTDFPWSNKLEDTLKRVFKIDKFREHQLSAMNAVISRQDAILVMPTGGGKSLCYQLPATVMGGVSIVVSPLIALMEDQLNGLKKLGIQAGMLNAKADKDETKAIWDALDGKNKQMNLIYVTPEFMKKSKRFMSKLQKAFNANIIKLFAIDEVHCCSTWGHDFRPDYQFLGCLKVMFPEVPILGLTATATVKIIDDVQKMLDIQGCLILRAPYNRPNLFYEVRRKPSEKENCLSMISNLLKTRFVNKSGIIYTTTIKDAEQLTTDLRSEGLKIGCYHAMLEPNVRTKIYQRWISGEYQAVVATIAFGLGIDKPDVRFVIHHCVSKSMENYYQESGRAGRDGKKATCIVLYRLADIFKLSTMVIGDKVGLLNLYKTLDYCLNNFTCRRNLLANHFDENWNTNDCNKMCDHCLKTKEMKHTNISKYCRQIYQIIEKSLTSENKLTLIKLIDAWYGKGTVSARVSSISPPSFPKHVAENIIAFLLINDYLKEDFSFNAYANLTYLNKGKNWSLLSDKNYQILFPHDVSLNLV